MPRDEEKPSIDFAELARLLAGETPTPTPKPTSAKVAEAPAPAPATESGTLTNAPKTPPSVSTPINVSSASTFNTPMTISGQVATPTPVKNISQMTQAEIDAFTAKQVASGIASLGIGIQDKSRLIPGESFAQANARISAGYEKMLAKPVPSQEQIAAGMKVQYVRTEAGGVGSYTIVVPPGYKGERTVTNWTAGIIPSNSPYVTGTTLGVMSDGKGGYTTVTGAPIKSTPKVTTATTGTTPTPTPTPSPTPTPTPTPTVSSESTGIKPPPGTPPAFVYDDVSKTWVMPPYPKDGVKYTWDDAVGWVNVNVVPGPTGTSQTETRNLAPNTFKNTLSLMFGPNEANQPWMDELFKVVSSYYKTGSTIEEAIDLSLRDVRNNPNMTKFTQRFKAIFALEDMVREGRPVYVPTVSEYVKTEEKLGDVLTRAGLQDMATSTELSDILATGKSVTEITSIIQDAFNAIDTAPEVWKKQLSATFPTATRTGLAKALLFGEKGAQQLQREIGTAGVQAAAASQGLTITGERATDLFAGGYTFQTSMPKFGQVAAIMPTARKLSDISGRPSDTITQAGVESAVFGQNAAQLKTLEDLAAEEQARFAGRAGSLGSRAFASRERGMRSF